MTKIRGACSLPFHHPSRCPGGEGQRGETGNETIIRFVLRTLGMALTKPAPPISEQFKELLQRVHSHVGNIFQTEDSGYQLSRLKKSQTISMRIIPLTYNGLKKEKKKVCWKTLPKRGGKKPFLPMFCPFHLSQSTSKKLYSLTSQKQPWRYISKAQNCQEVPEESTRENSPQRCQ